MCAVPKDKVKVPPNCLNVIQCCPNTPVLGGKNKKPSKFCAEHSNEIRDDGFIPRLEQFSNLPEIVRNGQVEENDDESVLVCCKKRKNIDRFYDRTAEVLAAVRPCRIAAAFCEMFTCESPSQVFCFIFNLFGKAAENFSRLKALGYDRT